MQTFLFLRSTLQVEMLSEADVRYLTPQEKLGTHIRLELTADRQLATRSTALVSYLALDRV